MTNKKKKEVRDIQDRTGWKYQFCQFLVSALGYEEVSRAVDDRILSEELNIRAKKVQKEPMK